MSSPKTAPSNFPLKGNPVVIEWVDAVTFGNWMPPENYEGRAPVLVQSVGWIVEETPHSIQVAQSRNALGLISDTIVVPKRWIKRKMRLMSCRSVARSPRSATTTSTEVAE